MGLSLDLFRVHFWLFHGFFSYGVNLEILRLSGILDFLFGFESFEYQNGKPPHQYNNLFLQKRPIRSFLEL